MDRGDLLAGTVACGVLATGVAGVVLGGVSGGSLVLAAWTAAGLAAAHTTARMALRFRGTDVGRAWRTYFAAAALWAAGAIVRDVTAGVAGLDARSSAASLLWAASALAFSAGIVQRLPSRKALLWSLALDAIPPVMFAVAIQWHLRPEGSSAWSAAVASLVGAATMLAAVCGFQILTLGRRRKGPAGKVEYARLFFGAGFASMAVAGILWPPAVIADGVPGGWTSLLWIAGLLGVAGWAFVRRGASVGYTSYYHPEEERAFRALPGSVAVLGLVVLALFDLDRDPLERALTLVAAVALLARFLLIRRAAGLAQQRLRAERDFVTTLIDTTGALVVAIEPGGAIATFNRACERLTGYEASEMVGMPLDPLIPPEELDEVRERLRPLVSGEATVSGGENHWLTKTGERRRLVWSNTAIPDRNGRTKLVIASGLDVTEHHDLERQLQLSQRLESVGRLAGGIAHDFNNLLTAILGHSEFALDSLAGDDPARADIEQIERAAIRARQVTSGLLTFSGRAMTAPKTVPLNDVVEQTLRMLERLLGEDVQVSTVLSQPLPPVRVDPGQLELVIVNLAINARDAMPDGGGLELATRARRIDEAEAATYGVTAGDYVELAVADSGVGMTPATRARAFDPFFTTKPTGKGTGLGLSTAYGVIQQCGGSIVLDSEPGRGTTVTILLPAALAAAESAAEEPLARPVAHARPVHATILLVEDEEPVRAVCTRALTAAGYDVQAHATPREALAAREGDRERIDALVTDLVLPGMPGTELAGRLRVDNPQLPVLFITGYSTERYVDDDPRTALLMKPFGTEELADAVTRLLRDAEAADAGAAGSASARL